MKPLTPTRRAEIYRRIAENIFNEILSGNSQAICVDLGYAIDTSSARTCVEPEFPEFFLFQSPAAIVYGTTWWEQNEEGHNCRILALLLSAEIALNP